MIKEDQQKSIDKIYIKKLSNFIIDASANIFEAMEDSIRNDLDLQKKIKLQLRKFNIFNIDKSIETSDIQNICLLSSFLFYLKTINKHVFEPNIFDEFKFTQDYFPVLKKNIKEIEKLNLIELNTDIFGSIYNTLFNNSEQTEKGQHFTNTDEVDIVNAFCINKNTKNVIDTACGAGAFLIRAYAMLKYHNPELNYNDFLERIWGVDIAPFPAFLTEVNLSILDSKNSTKYHKIINTDFSDLTTKSKLKLPQFDACIGNPPYIRQELIKDKSKWIDLVKHEFGIEALNKQSDLYVYYLMHTASFLKEGGRLGYVVASSWLDVSYGKDLQKFLLDHFKIIAIIDPQNSRSFQTASINTVILIIEKCSNREECERNNVKFVKINTDYSHIIGQFNDPDRFERLNNFVQTIEKTLHTNRTKNFYISSINQKELELQSIINSKYQNGHWGAKFLRVPEIYNKILNSSKDKLVPLREICEVKYGIKTGANDFFYLIDETHKALELNDKSYIVRFKDKKENHEKFWKSQGWFYSKLNEQHYIIERKYLKLILKSQREIHKLTIKVKELKYNVLDIKNHENSKIKESNSELYNYIKLGESSKYKNNKRATCAGRISKNGESDWFNLSNDIVIGDFIIPSKIGERFQLIDNRKAKVYCDKVSYNICIKHEYKEYSDILFAILNSTVFRYFIDLFSRQLTGSQTLSDVDVNIVQNTLIPNPKLFIKKKKELSDIMESMKKRKQESIFKEMEFDDRKQLDTIILSALEFGEEEAKELREKAVEFVQTRKTKSESIKTIKKPVIKR